MVIGAPINKKNIMELLKLVMSDTNTSWVLVFAYFCFALIIGRVILNFWPPKPHVNPSDSLDPFDYLDRYESSRGSTEHKLYFLFSLVFLIINYALAIGLQEPLWAAILVHSWVFLFMTTTLLPLSLVFLLRYIHFFVWDSVLLGVVFASSVFTIIDQIIQ